MICQCSFFGVYWPQDDTDTASYFLLKKWNLFDYDLRNESCCSLVSCKLLNLPIVLRKWILMSSSGSCNNVYYTEHGGSNFFTFKMKPHESVKRPLDEVWNYEITENEK